MFSFNFFKAINFAYLGRGIWGIPMNIVGKPGGAKSTIIEDFATRCGLSTHVEIGSIADPVDIGGLPVPDFERGCFTKLPPRAYVELAEKKNGLLFFDELPASCAAVQNASLNIVLKRVAGELQLPGTIRVHAAGNALKDMIGGTPLSAAMNNRFLHINWKKPTLEQFGRHCMAGFNQDVSAEIDPEKEQAAIMQNWNSEHAKVTALVLDFLKKNPNVYSLTEEAEQNLEPAYATPRSWKTAIAGITAARMYKLTKDEENDIIAGLVGAGAATEWQAYNIFDDLPDPEELLDGMLSLFSHSEARPDRSFVVLNSCATLMNSMATMLEENPNDEKLKQDYYRRAGNIWRLQAPVVEAGLASACVGAAGSVIRIRETSVLNVPERQEVIGVLSPLLRAAGYSV